MLKCEKCGIEYPSEIDFHGGGEGGPLICLSCHQSSGGSQEGEPVASGAEAREESVGTPDTDSVGAEELEKSPRKVSFGGLIAAAVLAAGGVAATRDPEMGGMAIMYFGSAIALTIRSFLPGMTWGRGVLVALGGYCVGVVLFMLALVDQLAALIGPVLMTFAFLWFGFKRGKIQWRKQQQ